MFRYHRTPPGELAVKRGAQLYAIDGCVGRADEFLTAAYLAAGQRR